MKRPRADNFSRRERQIMDALYRLGSATAAEVREAISDAPSYSAVRALLRILEEKGHVRHENDGVRHVYQPSRSRQSEAKAAVRRVMTTFFDDSVESAVAALIDASDADLTDEAIERMMHRIAEARRDGG